jgi:hypothetical protein
LSRFKRVQLIEHVDATGSAPEDVRARVAALRQAGCTVETLVLDGRGDEDLQYDPRERRAGAGPETLLPDATGLRRLAARVHAGRPDVVLWASAAPGGGEAARALPRSPEAFWWPTGHAPADMPGGPLAPLPGFAPPCDGSVCADERGTRALLSLWDGPFVLVPAPLSTGTADGLLEAFAQAADGRDEVDLVVLGHPGRRLEALARGHGVGQRVHFVGPAPREAEAAWLATATLALVAGDAPLSGGLLLRALEAGCAPVPVGEQAAPIAGWLRSTGCRWPGAGDPSSDSASDSASIAAAIAHGLDRGEGARRAREKAQEVARRFDVPSLAARLATALRVAGPSSEAA